MSEDPFDGERDLTALFGIPETRPAAEIWDEAQEMALKVFRDISSHPVVSERQRLLVGVTMAMLTHTMKNHEDCPCTIISGFVNRLGNDAADYRFGARFECTVVIGEHPNVKAEPFMGDDD